MDMLLLYEVPFWVNAVILVIPLFIAKEIGFRVGLRRHRQRGDAAKSTRGDVTLGSMLALLGLMLAFTYAFSLSRADMRKQATISEANAIGTAFLRADLAPEPARSQLRARLLEYGRTRVVAPGRIKSREDLRDIIHRSREAQSQLWPTTKLALQGDADGPLPAALVQSVIAVLDAHTERIAAVFDRMPWVVFFLLILIASVSLGVAAHNAGLNGSMNRWRMSAFALVLAALMLVIIDFDRSKTGFIVVSNAPLQSVIQEMEEALEVSEGED